MTDTDTNPFLWTRAMVFAMASLAEENGDTAPWVDSNEEFAAICKEPFVCAMRRRFNNQ